VRSPVPAAASSARCPASPVPRRRHPWWCASRRRARARALHGLTRSLVATWCRRHPGLQQELEIVGVGYRANAKAGSLELALGYSHRSTSTHPMASPSRSRRRPHHRQGIDKERVASGADIRKLRKPGPTRARLRYAVSACSARRKSSEVMLSKHSHLRIAVTPGARQGLGHPERPAWR